MLLHNRKHAREPHRFGVEHRPATGSGKPISIAADRIDIWRRVCYPFLENPGPFIDQCQHAARHDLFVVKQLDRSLLNELFAFEFLEAAANIIVVGPNGLGKGMIGKNLLHQALLRGYTTRFTAASAMLHDLAAQDSSTQLARRLRHHTAPGLLC